MTTLLETAKQALDVLQSEYSTKGTNKYNPWDTIEALRQAIEQQELADAFAENFPNTWGKKKHTSPQQQNNAINQALAYLQTGQSLDVAKAIQILKEINS